MLNVDPQRRQMVDGEPHEGCSGTIRENHDNFECRDCGFTDWEGHRKLVGIYVRAKYAGKLGSYDIAELDRTSLIAWLAECDRDRAIVLRLLGHDA